MSQRFDVGGVIASATPVVYDLFDSTDNPSYYNKDGSAPVASVWLSGVTITSYGAFKAELGICDITTKANFVPVYPTYSTLSTAGGLVKAFLEGQPLVALTATRRLCLKITTYTDSTVFAAGDVDLRSR